MAMKRIRISIRNRPARVALYLLDHTGTDRACDPAVFRRQVSRRLLRAANFLSIVAPRQALIHSDDKTPDLRFARSSRLGGGVCVAHRCVSRRVRVDLYRIPLSNQVIKADVVANEMD